MNRQTKEKVAGELVRMAKDLVALNDLPPEIDKLNKPFSMAVNKVLDGIQEYNSVMNKLSRMNDYPPASEIGKRGVKTARERHNSWMAIMEDFTVLRTQMNDWKERVGSEKTSASKKTKSQVDKADVLDSEDYVSLKSKSWFNKDDWKYDSKQQLYNRKSSNKTAKSNIVLINNLWDDVKYFTRRGLDSTDRQVFKLVNQTEDVITMGKIIGVPLKFWKSNDKSDFREHGLDEKFAI